MLRRLKMTRKCIKCGVELTDENWYQAYQKKGDKCCKECARERSRMWRINNPEKAKEKDMNYHRNKGVLPMGENKECSSYLGIHIAERVLRNLFKDVEVMPMNHPGYDIICNHGKKIDVKSSCLHKDGRWSFTLKRNKKADYFICVAFDNRIDLKSLHIWMLPGEKFNHLTGVCISPSTVDKWNEYKLDVNKLSACCNMMRGDTV